MDSNQQRYPKQTASGKQKEYPYKSLRGLSRVVRGLFITTAVLSFVGVVIDIWGWIFFTQVKEGAPMTGDLREFLDGCFALQALGVSVVLIIALLTFLRWFYLLRRNMFALKAPFFVGHPLDIIAAFLIPVYNLFKPLSHAEDIWKATTPGLTPGQDWTSESAAPLLTNWWLFWVAYSIASNVANYTAKATEHTNSWKPFLTLYLCNGISDVLSIVNCVFTVLIIAKLTERQEAYKQAMEKFEAAA